MIEKILKGLEHNPNHYIRVHLFGREYRFCSRCLGMYSVGSISSVVFALLYFYGVSLPFWFVFSTSWILALFCFVDWGSVKLGWRTGSNRMRVITGGLLGVGLSFYFWLLPVSWTVRLVTLILYQVVFGAIVYVVHCRERGFSVFEPFKTTPDKLWCINCSGCCPCCCNAQSCATPCMVLCCCCLPLMMFFPCAGGGCSSGKGCNV